MRDVIERNIHTFLEKLHRACQRAGRKPDEIKVVAVSKTFPAEFIRWANEFGIKDFGENYVQEALKKMEELKDLNITWHFVGRIQTNKIKNIIANFDYVHSLSSEDQILEFEKRWKGMRRLRAFLQINIGREKTKGGIYEEDVLEFLRRFHERNPRSLELVGLMIIPPPVSDPEDSRVYFRRLREIRDLLVRSGYLLPELSMGMSDDFEVAVEEGATILRIGRAIFGERREHGK